MKKIIVIAENMRSTHNVGALLRTCEGLGVSKVYLCGITPYPKTSNDVRLPHIADKLHKQITKTALGAEQSLAWEYREHVSDVIEKYRHEKWCIVGLEQTKNSLPLESFHTDQPIVLVLGTEVTGIEKSSLLLCDQIVEIPMYGNKESFNVVIAAGIALYTLMNS